MMMVDTINPNTNEPDSFGGANPQAPLGSDTNLGDSRFFSGFNQPDEVKVNLATPSPGDQPSGSIDSLSAGPVLRPAEPGVNSQPLESHNTYSSKPSTGGVNWRGVVVIALMGIFLSGIISGITWFAINSSTKKTLTETSSELNKLKSDLAALKETPNPLELPSEVVETPSTEPTSPVVETPTAPDSVPTEEETITPPANPQIEPVENIPTRLDGSTGGTG